MERVLLSMVHFFFVLSIIHMVIFGDMHRNLGPAWFMTKICHAKNLAAKEVG